MIAADDLQCTWPGADAPALALARLELAAGRVHLLAGPSGCGKSTLVMACCGAMPQLLGGTVTGSLQVAGHDPRHTPVAQLSEALAVVQQDVDQQIVADRVDDDIAFGLENRGLERARIAAAVETALERAGIRHLAARRPAQLSCGERQRVALAGVLATAPRALLLDEPLAFLDRAAAAALMAQLRELSAQGTAVGLVEHRHELVRAAVDDTTWLTTPGAAVQPVAPDVDFPELPAGASAERLTCRALSCGHGREPLLHEVAFSLGRGESAVLLGANGSGKTTLLSALLGLTRLHSGAAWCCGARVRRGATRRLARHVALVLQNPDHQLRLSRVVDEVAWGAVDAAAVGTELAACGLTQLAQRHPLTLSFGERRRVTIAAALARRPALLLLDEPTVGQDDRALARLLTRLAAYRTAGGCLVVATHDARAVRALGGTVLRIADGRCHIEPGTSPVPSPIPETAHAP